MLSHIHDAPDAVAGLHLLEGLVDLPQRLAVGDELVDFEFALGVVVDQLGELGAALDAAECAALPHATGDELEGCRSNQLDFHKSIRNSFKKGKEISGIRRVEIS